MATNYKLCVRCGRPHYNHGDHCNECYEYLRVTTGHNACRQCNGTGTDPKTGRTCTACNGTGKAR